MKILLVYATYSGSTRIVGTIMQEVLEKNHNITLRSVFEVSPDEFGAYDFIILGSNSWFELKQEGQMNSGFHALKEKLKTDQFTGKNFAIYALGDSNLYHNTFCKSAEHLEKLIRQFGGDIVTSPLKIDRFYFDEEENEKKVISWAQELDRFLKQRQSH